ncbi:hypothetical protein TNIN_46891, partial [Trichonephila inaurata madagascariensis]
EKRGLDLGLSRGFSGSQQLTSDGTISSQFCQWPEGNAALLMIPSNAVPQYFVKKGRLKAC